MHEHPPPDGPLHLAFVGDNTRLVRGGCRAVEELACHPVKAEEQMGEIRRGWFDTNSKCGWEIPSIDPFLLAGARAGWWHLRLGAVSRADHIGRGRLSTGMLTALSALSSSLIP